VFPAGDRNNRLLTGANNAPAYYGTRPNDARTRERKQTRVTGLPPDMKGIIEFHHNGYYFLIGRYPCVKWQDTIANIVVVQCWKTTSVGHILKHNAYVV